MSKMHFSPSLGRLARCTSDKCPYEHFNTELMKRMAPVDGYAPLKILKNSYVGIEVTPQLVAPALNQLRSAMSPGLFDHVSRKLTERNGPDKFHITVISPSEFRRLKSDNRLVLPTDKFRFQLSGVGSAANQETQAWFAVANSVTVDRFRYSLGLPKSDLHVTLGFTVKDIHGVKKDSSTLL